MVEKDHPRLSIVRQCRLLGLPRSTYYSVPKGESGLNLELMRRIDMQFLETPFCGSRQMCRHLRHEGFSVGRQLVKRLMRKRGLTSVYQKRRTTKPH